LVLRRIILTLRPLWAGLTSGAKAPFEADGLRHG
jgi:hypothetical protein